MPEGSRATTLFLDGNKRTAFVAMELFLMKNGRLLAASNEDAVVTFLHLAAGEIAEDDLLAWILPNLTAKLK